MITLKEYIEPFNDSGVQLQIYCEDEFDSRSDLAEYEVIAFGREGASQCHVPTYPRCHFIHVKKIDSGEDNK